MVGDPVVAGLFGRIDMGVHEALEVRDQLLNFFRMIEIQFLSPFIDAYAGLSMKTAMQRYLVDDTGRGPID